MIVSMTHYDVTPWSTLVTEMTTPLKDFHSASVVTGLLSHMYNITSFFFFFLFAHASAKIAPSNSMCVPCVLGFLWLLHVLSLAYVTFYYTREFPECHFLPIMFGDHYHIAYTFMRARVRFICQYAKILRKTILELLGMQCKLVYK